MSEILHQRAREARKRVLLRAWELRQRHHARGVWYRLRRVLAEAKAVYAISERAAKELLAEGFLPEHVGEELQPPKILLFAPEERLLRVEERRPVSVRLGADLLEAPFLALVRFD